MRRITVWESICFGSGICTRMPWMAASAFRRSTTASNSACEVEAGSRIVSPCIPASRQAFSFDATYTMLPGSAPTRTAVSPGTIPCFASAAAAIATSARTFVATAAPSMISAGNVYRSLFADCYDLDLTGVLQLRLHPPRDLLRQRLHARVVHVVGIHDHADLAAGLDREHAIDSLVARRDLLESLEPLHVRLEGLATRAGA